MKDYQQLLTQYSSQLAKAIKHLEYSLNKVNNLPADASILNDEQLETWEGFLARFARACDIFLAKYLRTRALIEDPGFNGTLRDLLNWGEKMGIITSAQVWLNIRELRNLQAHEYAEDKLSTIFKSVLKESVHVLKLKELL